MTNATYTKLNTGAWGVRVNGPRPTPGAVVTVARKDGTTKTATVVAVLWHGTARDGQTASLCSIADSAPRARGGHRRACRTDGNCSSFGSGRNCGGHDCDGY